MSQSGGKSGAVRFSERHAICSPLPLGSRQSTFDCSFIFFPSPPSFFLLISQPQSPGHLHRALVSLHGARKRLAWAAQSDCGGFFPPLFVYELHDSSDRPILRTYKRALLASPISPLDCHLSLLSVFIRQVGWHRFLFIFLNGTGSYANTLGKYEKSSLFFLVSQCPDLWLSVDA